MRDVIIIGAGGGGAVVAKELAEQGLDVLLLEAGPHHTNTEQQWSHYEVPATSIFRWGPANPFSPAWRRNVPSGASIFQSAAVGGTTLQYFGNSPRAMPGAFAGYDGADAAMYDVDHRFPFTYGELVKYYRHVEAILPVQTAAMGTKESIFFEGAERIGLAYQRTKNVWRDSFRPQPNAILQPGGTAGTTSDPAQLEYPKAEGCTLCGHCMQGCFLPRRAPRNLKAKRSTYNSYVPMALTADLWGGGRAAELVSDAFVTQIFTEPSGGRLKATGVAFRIGATGEQLEEDAKVVVMACGAIETPRLWLNSGLPDANGWVGAGLTTHATDLVVGIMPFETKSSQGPASAARCDFPGRGSLESFGAMPGTQAGLGLLASEAGNAGTVPPDGSGADVVGRLVGPALKDAMSDVDRLMNVVILTDDDVNPESRVMLTPGDFDDHGGVPLVTASSATMTARTQANREYLTQKAVELLHAAGAETVVRSKAAPSMIHLHSSMRMGSDPSNSVLDESCEARAVEGLYVADNSALANALGGPNPTLTTQALATRTAEKILEKHFGGDPWITFLGTPTTSIDPRVTEACVLRGL